MTGLRKETFELVARKVKEHTGQGVRVSAKKLGYDMELVEVLEPVEVQLGKWRGCGWKVKETILCFPSRPTEKQDEAEEGKEDNIVV